MDPPQTKEIPTTSEQTSPQNPGGETRRRPVRRSTSHKKKGVADVDNPQAEDGNATKQRNSGEDRTHPKGAAHDGSATNKEADKGTEKSEKPKKKSNSRRHGSKRTSGKPTKESDGPSAAHARTAPSDAPLSVPPAPPSDAKPKDASETSHHDATVAASEETKKKKKWPRKKKPAHQKDKAPDAHEKHSDDAAASSEDIKGTMKDQKKHKSPRKPKDKRKSKEHKDPKDQETSKDHEESRDKPTSEEQHVSKDQKAPKADKPKKKRGKKDSKGPRPGKTRSEPQPEATRSIQGESERKQNLSPSTIRQAFEHPAQPGQVTQDEIPVEELEYAGFTQQRRDLTARRRSLDGFHFAPAEEEKRRFHPMPGASDFYVVDKTKEDKLIASEDLPAKASRSRKEARDGKEHKERGSSRKADSTRPPREQRNDRHDKPPPSEYVHPDDVLRGRRPQFSPFMDPRLIERGLQDGSLVKGELRINKRLRADAYVTSESLDHDIFINGSRNRNRALDGDVVAVRLLDTDKAWEAKKERMRRRKLERESVPADMEVENLEDEDDEEEDEDKDKPKYAGEVVGIIERSNHLFAGILLLERPQSGGKASGDADKGNTAPEESMESKLSHQRLAWFKPTDKRTPLIAIIAHQAPPELVAVDGKQTSIVSARITRWPIDALFPFGKIVRSLGPTGSIAAETVATLTDCDIIDASFPSLALKALPPTPWEIPPMEYKKRRDLRDTCIFTIDPSTAKDLDDAVHITPLDDGNFEVGVHIADVSYFVKRNTPLDTEARKRGTSTYLVERVIPMLPSLLCEQLCSLNPGVERLAFSVIWKMDPEGNVLDTWFGRSIIKSCAKLAYDDAQNVIEGKGLPEPVSIMDYSRKEVEDAITHLYKLSKCMRKRRFDGGALSINSVRLSIKLDAQGEPESVSIYELKDANRLIEEFMLCANMSVAEKICTHYPEDAMLRRHSPPIERRLDEFLKQAEDLGFGLDGSTAGALQQSFSSIESDEVKQVLMVLAIKPMQRAKYFCTGALSEDKYMHYALNVPLYTHFTSPIRRYADIMVHRQLDAAIRNLGSHGYNTKSVAKIAAECNRNRDNAKNAQDMNIQLYLAHYLAKLEKKEGRVIRQAVVVQVLKDAFDMLIPEYGIEKRVFSEDLPLVKRRFDPNDMALSLYWKKGVTPTADGHDLHEEDEDEDEDEEGGDEDEAYGDKKKKMARRSSGGLYVEDEDLDESGASRPAIRPEDIQKAPDEELDAATCMQKFKVFTKFDALIQVNMEKSPPIINVYPVNPFQ